MIAYQGNKIPQFKSRNKFLLTSLVLNISYLCYSIYIMLLFRLGLCIKICWKHEVLEMISSGSFFIMYNLHK